MGFLLVRTRVSLGLRVEMMIVALATATRIPRFKPFCHIVGHNNSF